MSPTCRCIHCFSISNYARLLNQDVFLLMTRGNIISCKYTYKKFSPEHLGSPPVFCGVRVARSLVLYVCFVDRYLSFCTFSFGHCVFCSSSIYGFWLPLWYLQTLLRYCWQGTCIIWLRNYIFTDVKQLFLDNTTYTLHYVSCQELTRISIGKTDFYTIIQCSWLNTYLLRKISTYLSKKMQLQFPRFIVENYIHM